MAHGHETGLAWEWDSVLLLANPSLTSHSLEGDGSTSCGLPGSSAADQNHEHDNHCHEHNHEHNHDKFHAHETSSADHVQTDSISSGSQQMGVNTDWRDPRLDCPNFLAGRVPCACTDNDDDDSGVSRKRSKPVPRCQVQSCGAELTNLKGYHQRHRVCLRCAHATRVVLRNQPHRYCQQCGKFHPICDFDEGKRSCRRKLERHNNRRRRKALESEDTLPPLDSGDIEPRSDSSPADDAMNTTKPILFLEGEDKASSGGGVGFDSEMAQPSAVVTPNGKFIASKEADEAVIATVGTDVEMSLQPLAPPVDKIVEEIFPTSEPSTKSPELVHSPEVQHVHKKDCLPHPEHVPISRDSHLSNTQTMSTNDMSSHHISPRDPQEAERLVRGHDEESLLALLMEDNSATEGSGLSQNGSVEVSEALLWDSSPPPIRPSKQATYSSPNPTGRISFKLYDWNPGDFPRQLRQQVMQWLSQMPVDLEGYIRSGCTILTLFVSMPQPMWEKLNADWTESVLRLVRGQCGTFKFWNSGYLIARVGQQIVHVENGKAVHPLCGRSDQGPMLEGVYPSCLEAGVEQVVVISGSNLQQSESRLLVSFDGSYIKNEVSSPGMDKEKADSSSLLQATFPALHSQKYGTAFIEVEHTTGISNFIPLLVAEKKIVDEVRTLELEIDTATTSCCSSQSHDSRFQPLNQKRYHDLLVDLGWVLRNYTLNNFNPHHQSLGQDVERLQGLLLFGVRRGWYTTVQRVLQVAKRSGVIERIGFLKNGMTALHVALLHQQFAMMDHLTSLMASLACAGSCASNSWWDVDCPVSRGLTARQVLTLQAKRMHYGSAKPEGRKLFGKSLAYEIRHVSQPNVNPDERRFSKGCNSKADICPKNLGYRLLSKESPDYHEVDVLCSTEEEEARFFFPSVDHSRGKISTWNSLLRRDDVDTQVKSLVPYGRSRCSVEGLTMYISRASTRRPVYASTVGVLLVCAGLCVMLQHPNEVIELSLSLRRCLWGLQNGPV
ncbi:protein MpSPL4 [Marchantia polymorpha subsp. ruderalis]|uniref:SBP-type domain-containing protein n=1 Tax=Marchantia polymorpha TaxID=3197 RepID=A0A2R6XMD1_MARPO|nr:hypothetical protein MARPO_0008s0031 [Marchantia polymorpha]BBN19580.1 hypothetical protein Mp_8g11850 [Marchantia polymorpha subsp. ruderalis]|eukprot:PTQ47244.1 hypothetical protein MARPO_0008s0031 [Marchantia polymorpha]